MPVPPFLQFIVRWYPQLIPGIDDTTCHGEQKDGPMRMQ